MGCVVTQFKRRRVTTQPARLTHAEHQLCPDLGPAARRVLIVWLYNNAGKSVSAAVVFHMITNVTWQLFPVSGSYFDPRVTGLIEAFIAAGVTATWGPGKLIRGKERARSWTDKEPLHNA
jgi:hypothetical protein